MQKLPLFPEDCFYTLDIILSVKQTIIYVRHAVHSPQFSPPMKQSPHSGKEGNQKGGTQLPSCP